MPVYEYSCARCGDFTAMRAIRERDELQPCPGCEAPAIRHILSAPASHLGDTHTRKAHALNERAAHEPRVRAAKTQQAASAEAVRPQFKRADCGRPWMLGH